MRVPRTSSLEEEEEEEELILVCGDADAQLRKG